MTDQIIENAKGKFLKAIDLVRQDLATIRTGRATPSLIENVLVSVYGTKMHLIELATIHAPEPHLLLVSPYDQNNTKEIAETIQVANLGLTPIIDHNVIRITVALLTQERREELVKLMHQKLEGGRIILRQTRREVMDEISKSAENEDTEKRLDKELQDLVDKMMAEIDLLGEQKEKELMMV